MPKDCLIADIVESADRFTKLRRDIHAHPELGFDVTRTADIVAKNLREWGYRVETGIGRSGVVAQLTNGSGTRRIGLRADMDALPVVENTGLPWESQHHGHMHACGHDGHTAMLLAAAEYLAKTRHFDGTVNLIFQPNEENLCGAPAMIEDGLFERFPCDAVYAMHNAPGIPVGKVLAVSGPMTSSSDRVDITLKGVGGHGAMPHHTKDPVVAAAAIVMAVQTIVSRNVDPGESCVVSTGILKAGTTFNVIPETAEITLNVRAKSPGARDLIEQRIREIVTTQAAVFGVEANIEYVRLVPVLVNHPNETRFFQQVLVDLLGEENVLMSLPRGGNGSEDFAWMLEAVPGCYIAIGNGVGEWHGCHVHNPGYDFNDEAIPVGASIWVRLVETYLK
ncbi:M20 aminoacylase family protein [Paraburkholderia saeva]|uniref:M20 aminoacylase family protein n=1 Tax=Paraburkholderia saeva TaxID=2777537 RepID=UPI001DAF145B|nr:M20 aminoacylase family protein [Paraburkholderia saeva]CAG4895975.1 Hippurate hydrolase [Paraburkholderia saeva]